MSQLPSDKLTIDRVKALEGMISPEEVEFLRGLAETVSDGVIVEIGSYRGKSAAALALGSAHGARLPIYAVDPHEDFRGVLGGRFGDEDRRVFFQAMLSTDAYRFVRLINLHSEDAARAWNRPVALLFIDGDHRYEAVQLDVQTWKRHLTESAVVVFDDIDHTDLGPRLVAEELIASGEFRLIGQVGKVWALRRYTGEQAAICPPPASILIGPSVANLPLDDIDRLRWSFNSFVSRRYRLLYVSTAKAACTSMKHLLATLQGEESVLSDGLESWEVDRDLVIHERHLWKKTPSLADLNAEEQKNVLEGAQYFRYALVRNPFTRIFSAWQSKLLLQEPFQVHWYRNASFLQREIQSKDDISASFEEFLEYILAKEWPSIKNDHWALQVRLLFSHDINYSRVGKVEEMSVILADLAEHVGKFGGRLTPMPRHNESLIPWDPALLSPRSMELIRHMYSEDFERFGYSMTPPPARKHLSEDAWQPLIEAIHMIRSRHGRFGEVRRRLGQLLASEAALSAELSRIERSRGWRMLALLTRIRRRFLPSMD